MAKQTITGMFETYADATNAVRKLEAVGVPHADISIVANNVDKSWTPGADAANDQTTTEAGPGAGVGAAIGGAGGLLAGLGMLAIPGVGPVVAAGWLAATAVGAVGGAAVGGLAGSMMSAGVTKEDAEVYAEGVRRGGSVVSAKVDDALVPQAEDILDEHGAIDADERRTAYRGQGWTGYDAKAEPFTPEQVRAERDLY